ncbi:hypothetical protein ACFQ08_28745, partial [Streptosporangium algeriense]
RRGQPRLTSPTRSEGERRAAAADPARRPARPGSGQGPSATRPRKGALCPTWEELTGKEREGALPDARNYLESAINAGAVPAVELIHNGPLAGLGDINREIERQAITMATAAATFRSTVNLID